MTLVQKQIHEKALVCVRDFLSKQLALIEVLYEVEVKEVFRAFGHTSLYAYCEHELKLSDSQRDDLIRVMRLTKVAPEIKSSLKDGKITLSNAKRIASVITPDTKEMWLEKAAQLSQEDLCMEIKKRNPEKLLRDFIRPIAEDLFEMRFGMKRDTKDMVVRSKEVMSQMRNAAAVMDELLRKALGEFLDKHDPVEKAKRAQVRAKKAAVPVAKLVPPTDLPCPNTVNMSDEVLGGGGKQVLPAVLPVVAQKALWPNTVTIYRREPIPAWVEHQVNLRDQGRCRWKLPNGLRCNSAHWVHLHHIIRVAMGGSNTPENLITLCSEHHRMVQQRSGQQSRKFQRRSRTHKLAKAPQRRIHAGSAG